MDYLGRRSKSVLVRLARAREWSYERVKVSTIQPSISNALLGIVIEFPFLTARRNWIDHSDLNAWLTVH